MIFGHDTYVMSFILYSVLLLLHSILMKMVSDMVDFNSDKSYFNHICVQVCTVQFNAVRKTKILINAILQE